MAKAKDLSRRSKDTAAVKQERYDFLHDVLCEIAVRAGELATMSLLELAKLCPEVCEEVPGGFRVPRAACVKEILQDEFTHAFDEVC